MFLVGIWNEYLHTVRHTHHFS